jgi:hypothetical protein
MMAVVMEHSVVIGAVAGRSAHRAQSIAPRTPISTGIHPHHAM